MASSSSEEDEDMPAATQTSDKGSYSEPEEEEPEEEEEEEQEEVEEEDPEEEEEEPEEVDDEDPEEEEEEEEKEEEPEEEGEADDTGEEGEENDDDDDDDDDRNDSSREIESEGPDEDLKLEISEGDTSEDNGQCRSLNALPATQGVGAQSEKEAPIEACGNLPKHDKEDLTGNEAHLNKTESVDNTKFSASNEKEVAADTRVGNHSGDKVLNLGSKEETRQSREDVKLREPSLITPQIRPRSLSPGAEFEERNKRPAILCNFFAKGWCIKGNSCRFLHQKYGVDNTSNLAKGDDETVESSKGELQEDAGLRQNAEKPKFSSPEPLASSLVAHPSSSPQFSSEKLVFRACEESRKWPTSSEEHGQLTLERDDPRLLSPLKYVKDENLRQTVVLDKYRNNASQVIQGDLKKVISPSNDCPANPSSSANQCNSFLGEESNQSSHVPLHGNLNHHSDHMDIKKSGSQKQVRGYSLAQNNSVPDFRFSASGSVVSSSIYGNYTSLAYEKTIVEHGSQNLKSHPTFYEGRASPGSYSSLNSSFKSSLPPTVSSPLHRPFACPRTSPSQGSSPLRYQKPFGSDIGYYASRSTSLPRTSSSPFYSRPEPDNMPLHGVAMDPVVSVGHKLHATAYNWETSVPFRPSFHLPPNFISSPSSQYDPLLDSIELPNIGDRSMQSSSLSQRAVTQNTLQINGDSICLDQLSQSGASDKSKHTHGVAADMTAAETSGTCGAGRQKKSSIPEEEKLLKPGSVVDVSNSNEVGLDHSVEHIDGIKHKNEPKSLKLFRSALVDFVKELVKPSWREGQLSKDAHNMVVKKAVEKVLSTLQPHQFPSTPQSANQYLSSCRPKLKKLVEGYIGKYGKS